MCQLFIDADPKLWSPVTRSFRMDGMVTSVRLETLFWQTLETIATRDKLTVPQLLQRLYNESLDAGHDIGNFTSFLRVCCLRYFELQVQGLIPTDMMAQIADLPAVEILHKEAQARRRSFPVEQEQRAI